MRALTERGFLHDLFFCRFTRYSSLVSLEKILRIFWIVCYADVSEHLTVGRNAIVCLTTHKPMRLAPKSRRAVLCGVEKCTVLAGILNHHQLKRCCQTDANQSQYWPDLRNLCRTKLAPLGKSGDPVELEIFPGVEVALQIEVVVNGFVAQIG
jgi:hypothetical protein